MKRHIFIILSLILLGISQLALATATSKATQVNFTSNMPTEGNLILGVFADGRLGPQGQAMDKNSNGALSHAIKAADFDAKIKTTQLITAPMASGLDQILLVGLGEQDVAKSHLQWQEIGGNAVQKAVDAFKTVPMLNMDISALENSAEINAHIAYGAKLGSYYFDKYYTDEKRHKHQKSLTFITKHTEQANQYFTEELNAVANGIWYTRDIANEPANIIYPQSFVDQWRHHFKGVDNIKIKVLDEKDMQKKGMGAIYGVGRGSKNPPRMMIVEYMGGEKGDAPVVLVGKGITFDTGGISIKGSSNMWNMKFDMSGAAVTMGTVYALAGRDAKVNVIGIAALAENMPGGNAQRPGDVVTSMSGKTIQIRSTDAEGRLVLADGVYYGDITYNPALLVDIATLTGSASRALGKDYSALFTRHNELVKPFITAGQQSGDEVWQLPLNDNHFKAIENNVADVMNSGPDAPGASAGAAFIGTFVRDTTPWVHLDVAGVSWSDKATPVKASPGSTGYGVRLLNNYIKTHFEK
jgi:leucyl aminopeptidase